VLFAAGSARPHIVLQWMGSRLVVSIIVLPATITSRTSGRLPSKYVSSGEISRFEPPVSQVLFAMTPPLLLKRPRLYLVCANMLFRITVPGVEKESTLTSEPRTTVAGSAELNITRQISEASNCVVEWFAVMLAASAAASESVALSVIIVGEPSTMHDSLSGAGMKSSSEHAALSFPGPPFLLRQPALGQPKKCIESPVRRFSSTQLVPYTVFLFWMTSAPLAFRTFCRWGLMISRLIGDSRLSTTCRLCGRAR
jgi:hypothetical protein